MNHLQLRILQCNFLFTGKTISLQLIATEVCSKNYWKGVKTENTSMCKKVNPNLTLQSYFYKYLEGKLCQT